MDTTGTIVDAKGQDKEIVEYLQGKLPKGSVFILTWAEADGTVHSCGDAAPSTAVELAKIAYQELSEAPDMRTK